MFRDYRFLRIVYAHRNIIRDRGVCRFLIQQWRRVHAGEVGFRAYDRTFYERGPPFREYDYYSGEPP